MYNYRLMSVAPSTRRLRDTQWHCYLKFCTTRHFNPLPCDLDRLSLYIAFLARVMKPSSIISYLQGIVFRHVLLGLIPPKLSDPQIKATLAGVKNKLGAEQKGKDPLFFNHLCSMYTHVDFKNHSNFLTWIASVLMFRCLLRVGHVVSSPHTLLRSSVTFTDYGFMLSIQSSKTKSKGTPPDYVPVNSMPGTHACIVYLLQRLLSKYPMPVGAPLFSTKLVPSLSYSSYSKNLRTLLAKAGIVGDYSSHSFRRGGGDLYVRVGLLCRRHKEERSLEIVMC